MGAGRRDRLSPGREREVGKEALGARPAHTLYSCERRVHSWTHGSYEPRYHLLDFGVSQLHSTSLERVPQWVWVRVGLGCRWFRLTRYSQGVFPGLGGAAALGPELAMTTPARGVTCDSHRLSFGRRLEALSGRITCSGWTHASCWPAAQRTPRRKVRRTGLGLGSREAQQKTWATRGPF